MLNPPNSKILFPLTIFGLTVASAIVLAAAISATIPAYARPIYAQQTGLPCGQCHINPEGAGPRTGFGKAFAANGHHLPGSRRHSRYGAWRDYGPGIGGNDYDGHMMGHYGYGDMMGGYGGMMGQ